MLRQKCQAFYTILSLPLRQTPSFLMYVSFIVGMGLSLYCVLHSFLWKRSLFFLSISRKSNYIVILNTRQLLARKKNLSWSQESPFQDPVALQTKETLCLKLGDLLSLSRHPTVGVVSISWYLLLLMWEVERVVSTIPQPCLKWARVALSTYCERGGVSRAGWLWPAKAVWSGAEEVGYWYVLGW